MSARRLASFLLLAILVACAKQPPPVRTTDTAMPPPTETTAPPPKPRLHTMIRVQPSSEALTEQQIAAAYKDLNPASFAWKPPAKAKVNHSESVTFRIAPKGAPSDFTSGMAGSGTVEKWQGTVSAIVRARLVGPAFTIDPKDPVQHVLLPGQTSEWQWFVTPNESGRQPLQLVTELVLEVNGKQETHPSYRTAQVDVAADPIGWMEDHWEWIIGTLLIPLAGALWKAWRDRRKAREAPPAA